MSISVITGASIVLGDDIQETDLWIRQGKVIEAASVDWDSDEITFVRGLVAPGFVDLKLNGAFGIDINTEVEPEKIHYLLKRLPEYGITSCLLGIKPTTKEKYADIFKLCRSVMNSQRTGSTKLQGLYLDGPFVAAGIGHGPTPSGSEMAELYGKGIGDVVRVVCVAPEIPDLHDALRFLRRENIAPSLGHTSCTYEQAMDAIRGGAKLINHLFNSMPAFHHRDPSLIGTLAASELEDRDDLHFGVIADLIHIHPASLRTAQRVKPKGLIIISDMHYSTGVHGTGNVKQHEKVDIRTPLRSADKQDSFELFSRETSPGSSSPINEALGVFEAGTDKLLYSLTPICRGIQNHYQYSGCSKAEAIAAASTRPGRVLGLHNDLSVDKQADFVILDSETLEVNATYIDGKCAYRRAVDSDAT